MPLRVSFHTLGCKLNQLETDALAEAFAREGALVLPFGADGGEGGEGTGLAIVNTCTVTAKADRSARRVIRLALEARPRSVVIVSGCYAQVEAEALAAIGERVLVLPGEDKAVLLDLPRRLAESGVIESGPSSPEELRALLCEALAAPSAVGRFAYNPKSFAFHSRPALKVQDGCDNDCAYCRVRIARGPSSSLPAAEVLARALDLERAGRAEIVLTGVNLSQYRDGERDFPGLLGLLLSGTERVSFRLSSYEPDAIGPAFLDAFSHPRVRPHLHLALQSGSDPILRAMGRRYSSRDALEATAALRKAKGDPFLGADLIAGFPGETEADFASTLELARSCGFARLHAFRFSPRPGTRAASLPGAVPERVAGERGAVLNRMSEAAAAGYAARWIGRELEAVLERDLRATAENYLKLKPRGLPESAQPGQAIRCLVEGLPAERTEGARIDAETRFLA